MSFGGVRPQAQFRFDHSTMAAGDVRQQLAETVPPAGSDMVLVASELVSNVVLHTHDGGEVRYWQSAAGRERVEVEDRVHRAPTRSSTADERGGMGLMIVQRLAESWGVEQTPQGKVVWAELAVIHRHG
jgi:anti-sigma regulatory factor (Ser/Thr protein kinase)